MKTGILHSTTVLRGQRNNLFVRILLIYITCEQQYHVCFKNPYISKWMWSRWTWINFRVSAYDEEGNGSIGRRWEKK